MKHTVYTIMSAALLTLMPFHPVSAADGDENVALSGKIATDSEKNVTFFERVRRFFGSDEVRRNIRRGNRFMHTGQRDRAIEEYTKAYQGDTTNVLAAYNLATSYFPDEWKIMSPDVQRDSLMEHHFLKAGDRANESNRVRRSMAYHNIGVMHQVRAGMAGDQKTGELMAAIEAYKQALRENPHDDEARYNLVLCQRQLPKGDNNDSNDNQPQNDGQQEQQEQQQQPQEQPQDDQQQQAQPPQQQEQNQEWIDQILNAAEQRERQTRRHIDENRQSNPTHPRRNEKNW